MSTCFAFFSGQETSVAVIPKPKVLIIGFALLNLRILLLQPPN
jgi:hypothetical protein